METDRPIKPEELLSTATESYSTPVHTQRYISRIGNYNRPIFYRYYVDEMLRDPHLWYGMQILKGPIISKAKFLVKTEDMELKNYIIRQITNFWIKGISKALECLSYGYAGNEVIYKFNEAEQQMDFHNLKFIHPHDCRPVIKKGEVVGMEVHMAGSQFVTETEPEETKFVNIPKCLWTVHDPVFHPWFGRSRLERAFDTWYEIWQNNGYRSIRHLWYYKNAYTSGDIYYPEGSTKDPETNEEVPNSLLAQEILDKRETGASSAFPKAPSGERTWESEPAAGNDTPEGLLEYGDVLRDELWEGIGVPPEVAGSDDSGSFSGRRVPQQGFYSYLQEIANQMIFTFDDQILSSLVNMTFGPEASYEIEPISILQTLQQEEMGLVTGKIDDGAGQEEDPGMEQDPELQENGSTEDSMDVGDGRVEDRQSNTFNIKEANSKKGVA